jgi:hypothetical protein
MLILYLGTALILLASLTGMLTPPYRLRCFGQPIRWCYLGNLWDAEHGIADILSADLPHASDELPDAHSSSILGSRSLFLGFLLRSIIRILLVSYLSHISLS